MAQNIALLKHIDGYLNTAPIPFCDLDTIGPFTCFFRRDNPMPEINYARPTGAIEGDVSSIIAQVRSAFASRGLPCRWEFLSDLTPAFDELLVAHGFPVPEPRPLMVVTQNSFTPTTASDVEVRAVTADETRSLSRVLDRAFGAPEESEPAHGIEQDTVGRMLAHGSAVFGAFVGSNLVAGGLHVPVGNTTEVCGVGTLPDYRKRGIAGALTSALVADAFGRGCECVFLSAMDESVQRIYARLGFELVGTAMDTMETIQKPELPK